MIQLHLFLQLSTLGINTHKENGVGGELYSQKMQESKWQMRKERFTGPPLSS